MRSPTHTIQKNKGLPIKKRGNPDLLQKQFLSSLDLNQPAQIEPQDQYNFEVEQTMTEIQKGSIIESDVNENIDPSHKSSSKLSSDNLHPIVMGCTFCLMFVMASKADPKCPECKKTLMIINSV
ncbi:protein GL2-INTERACTING REPRESSOR 2-like [Trifolium pratense]|uniref:protein GL2-INTERACTING REPRESSOR 2-like n=1 Tax=Trifolium pratense TaxID=57577 RepID=UPI001E692886|nr:protein GL2-INTERACTING REPRESSOR 2-like [Trifolium pratense]